MPKKGKKLTPEEKLFQQYKQELTPIFKLFDGDADGKLTTDELLYFLAAIAHPLENDKIEAKFQDFQYFDIDTAVSVVIEIEKVETIAYRLKWEYYAMYHAEPGLRTPIVNKKDFFAMMQAGDGKISDQYIHWMLESMQDKNRLKITTGLLEKHMKQDGKSQEEIDKAVKEVKDQEDSLFDLRYLIVHQYNYLATGQVMIKELAEQRKKEAQAKKEKEAKMRK